MSAAALNKSQIRQVYERAAWGYDWFEGFMEWMGLRHLRRQLLAKAQGATLEIAVGTGRNLPYYPAACRITACDMTSGMLQLARRRADRISLRVTWVVGDAESLPFGDGLFDTVVSSLSTCTFLDPVRGLQEMRRVCRGHGRILLLEHGRSDRPGLARWMDQHTGFFTRRVGCHWDREPVDLALKAGLGVNLVRRHFYGIYQLIEANPCAPETTLS